MAYRERRRPAANCDWSSVGLPYRAIGLPLRELPSSSFPEDREIADGNRTDSATRASRGAP